MFHVIILRENPFEGMGCLGGGLLALFCILAVPTSIYNFYFTPYYDLNLRLCLVGFAVLVSLVCSLCVKRPFAIKDVFFGAVVTSVCASTFILCAFMVAILFFASEPDFFGGILMLLVGPIMFGSIFLPPALITCAVTLGIRGAKS